jgi:DNA-binding NarL/FixJ family response regulator
LEVVLLDQQVIVLSQPKSVPTLAEDRSSAKCASSGNGNAIHDLPGVSAPSMSKQDPQFSQREREILIQLAEGNSNKQIARACNITESTVKVHLKAILRKITAHNRTQAAIWAIAKGYRVIPKLIDAMPKTTYEVGAQSAVHRPDPRGNGKSMEINIARK